MFKLRVNVISFGSQSRANATVVFQQVPGAGYHPSEGGSAPSWCICSNCREMTSLEKGFAEEIIPHLCGTSAGLQGFDT
ncbi:hypothetical protein ACF0H5_004517 [Mactra antiquata]